MCTSAMTALRKAEDELWAMGDSYCLDAALAMSAVLLEHALLLGSSLPGHEVKVRPLRTFARLRPALEVMSPVFTYSELVAEVERRGLPESTMRRLLKRVVERELLKHVGKLYEQL
jgi:hypothetical protein